MAGLLTVKIRDNSNKVGNFSIKVGNVTGATYDAMVTSLNAIVAATAPITSGNIIGATYSQELVTGADSIPSDKTSNVNTKARFFFIDDDNGKRQHLSVPSADYTTIATDGTNEISLINTDVSTFIAAIDAVIESDAGNDVTFYRAAQASTATRQRTQ